MLNFKSSGSISNKAYSTFTDFALLVLEKITEGIIIIIMLLLVEKVFPQQGWFWQYPNPQGYTLRDIFVFDSVVAIAVGDWGTVIKTTNGGMSWNVQHHAGGTEIDLQSVRFIDKMNGWAVGGIWWTNQNILLNFNLSL